MIRTGEAYKRIELSDEVFDVIVIGSGIGGLTTAALLSHYAGKRVLVLERHYVAGGYTHAFQRPGYDWDVGVHYIGDVLRENSDNRRIFDLVTGGSVAWESMGDVYDRIFIGDECYEYVAGLSQWREQMKGYFPSEAGAIDRYITEVKAAVSSSRFFFLDKALPEAASTLVGPALRSRHLRYASRTTREVIESLTSNERLISVLTGQYGDYGLPPRRSSFAIHAAVTNHYFRGGAYPVGGASQIAAGAERVIQKSGGMILINAEVEEILIRKGRAVGVRMADGKELLADSVVSNVGIINTYLGLVPEATTREIGALDRLPTVKASAAHLCLYMGMNRSTADLGLEKPNLWVYPDERHDENFAAYDADPGAPLPVVYLSFPSAKDPDFEKRHPGHSTIDVITLARHEWFTPWEGSPWKKRGERYEDLKERLRERILETVFRHVPQVKDHIEVQELSTPLTTQHFCNYRTGEIYGLDHSPSRFQQKWLRPRTPIQGLYLTGQDVCTAGVAGAMFGGVLAASAMEGRKLLTRLVSGRLG